MVSQFNELKKEMGNILFKKTKRMERERFNRTFALESEIIVNVYKNPEISVKELYNICKKEVYNLNEFKVEKVLKRYNIYDIEKRKEVILDSCKIIEKFYYAAREKDLSTSIESSEIVRSIVFQRKETKPDVKVRFFLIHLLELLKTEDDHILNTKIQNFYKIYNRMGDIYSRGLFVELFDSIANYAGIGKKKTIQETILESENSLNELIKTTSSDDSDNESEGYLQHQQIRDSLIVLSEQIDTIRNNYLAYQENAKDEEKKELFRTLNSEQHNKALDTLLRSNYIITNLMKEGWKPERPEIESVIFAVKSLIKAFESLGILPIYTLGEKITVSKEEINKFEYIGSEFQGNEKKVVEIISSGWKYKEEMISRPKIKEVEGEV